MLKNIYMSIRSEVITDFPVSEISLELKEMRSHLKDIDDCFAILGDKERQKMISPDELERKLINLLKKYLLPALLQAKQIGLSVLETRTLLSQTWELQGNSTFLAYVREHPGSFGAIDRIIDRDERALFGSSGHIIGREALNCAMAEQHRNKLNIQANTVIEVCQRVDSPHIMMVACGSSRDLEQPRVKEALKQAKAKLTLVDMVPEALVASRQRLEDIEDKVLIEYVEQDLRGLLRADFDNVDLWCAGGLFDYFSDRLIKRLLSSVKGKIKRNGTVLFTNVAKTDDPLLLWAEVMANWKLIQRSEQKMKELLDTLKFSKEDLQTESTGLTWIAKVVNQ